VSGRNWLVSAILALLCGGILVLFTDIEGAPMRWLRCGPLASQERPHGEPCR
jgi:hypothetical protein